MTAVSKTFRLFLAVAAPLALAAPRDSAAVTITVTSPVAAAVYTCGDTLHVKWSVDSASVTSAVLRISTDAGRTFASIRDMPVRPDSSFWGDYPWVIPAPVHGDACIVTVSDYVNMATQGVSGVFTIHASSATAPAIGLPCPSLVFTADSTVTMIVANSGGGTLPDVHVSNTVAPWLTVSVDNSPANTALLTVSASGASLADGIYRDTLILSGGGIADASCAVALYKGFTPGKVVISAPAGGEHYTAGDTVAVRWAAAPDVGAVTIRLSSDNGRMWTTIGDGAYSPAGASWGNARARIPASIPGLPSSTCLIGLFSYNDNSCATVSPAFSVDAGVVSGPAVRLQIYPDKVRCAPGDTVAFAGSGFNSFGETLPVTVRWALAQGAGTVVSTGVFVAGDSVGDFPVLASTLDGTLSARGLICVRQAGAAVAPVTVISPNGGEIYQTGQQVAVEWATDLDKITTVILSVSVDAGRTWNQMTDRAVTYSDTSWGRFVWTVPSTLGGAPALSSTCLVRVASYVDLTLADASNGVFSIVNPMGATVSQSGGTVSLGSVATLDVPALARKSQDVGDTLKIVETRSSVAPPWGYQLENSGDVFLFLPHGTTFNAPVEICIPFAGDTAGAKILRRASDTAATWDTIAPRRFDPAAGRVCFETSGFSVYAAAHAFAALDAVVTVKRPARSSASPAGVRIVAGAAEVRVDVADAGAHELTICTPEGRVLLKRHGSGPGSLRLGAASLPPGVYVVIVKHNGAITRAALAQAR